MGLKTWSSTCDATWGGYENFNRMWFFEDKSLILLLFLSLILSMPLFKMPLPHSQATMDPTKPNT